MIKVEQVYKSFGDLQVLKGIDLEVNRGDRIGCGTQRRRKNDAADDNGYARESRCGKDTDRQ